MFGVDVAHVISLANTFRQHGVKAEYVTAATKVAERSRLIDAFKRGEFPVLLNCGIFTEGTDIPSIDCVLLARPSKSRSLLSQMIGRGMRLYPGKVNCHIVDMVASLKEGIITAPTLFGLDPDVLVDGASAKEMNKMQERKVQKEAQSAQKAQIEAESEMPKPKLNYTDYDSVSDLLLDTVENRYIRRISPHNWIQVNPARFILADGPGQRSYLAIEEVEDHNGKHYVTKMYRKLMTQPGARRPPYAREVKLGIADAFDHAVHGADKYAAEYFTAPFIALRGRLAWWRSQPASQGQLDFLHKRLGHGEDDMWEAGQISKGEAADITTRLRFGVKTQFSRIAATQRREQQARKRHQERIDRETVKVGALPSNNS